MPRLNLTDISLRAIKTPPKGQVTCWDTQLAGFNVRASQGGSLTFSLVYPGDKRQRVSIGRVGVLSLKQARDKARLLLADRTLNGEAPSSLTFEDALTIYLSAHGKTLRPSTAAENERLLTRHFS